jgi:hypothetical protein
MSESIAFEQSSIKLERAERKKMERELKESKKEASKRRKEVAKRNLEERELRTIEYQRLEQERIESYKQLEINCLKRLYELIDLNSVKTKESYDECIQLLYGGSSFFGLTRQKDINISVSDEEASILFKNFSETDTTVLQTLTKELLSRVNASKDITGIVGVNICSTREAYTTFGSISGFFHEGKLCVGQVLLWGCN